MEMIKIENKDGQFVVSSRVVAEDFGKEHSKVLRAIDSHRDKLGKAKIGDISYFIESAYTDVQGKGQREVLLTKKGFSLTVNKFTGDEAFEFTVKYIEAFEKMEKEIEKAKRIPDLSDPMNLLNVHYQAIRIHDEKITAVEGKVIAIEQAFQDMNDRAILDMAESEAIQKAVKKRVVLLLGGTKSPAYLNKSTHGKAFSAVQRKLKEEFGVSSYKWIKKKHFETALKIIPALNLPFHVAEEALEVNNQCRMDV
ncbi:MAG: ORF6C domain-containing protein [Turicibacter sp.]|nr:ORF6C domain-containing protein [Turicibacter sp.]